MKPKPTLKYIQLEKAFKLKPLMTDRNERKIYKIRERIVTPRSLNLPYIVTDSNPYATPRGTQSHSYLSSQSQSSVSKRVNNNTNNIRTPNNSLFHTKSNSGSNSNKKSNTSHHRDYHHSRVNSNRLKDQNLHGNEKELSSQTPVKLHSQEEMKLSFIAKDYYLLPSQPHFPNTLQTPYQLIEVLSDVVDKVSDNYSNAPRINIMRSEYLINKVNQEDQRWQKRLMKSRKEIKSKEEEVEQYDTVICEDYLEIRMKNILRNYLKSKDNKLNQRAQSTVLDQFFKLFENKVNFIYDVYAVPFFKNKFIRFNIDNIGQMKQFNSHNYVDPGILRYLYNLRITIQKEKEETELIKRKREAIAEEEHMALLQAQVQDQAQGQSQGQGQTGKVISDIVNKNNSDILTMFDKENKTKGQLLKKQKTLNPKAAGNVNSNEDAKDNQLQAKEDDEESNVDSVKVYELEDFFIHKYMRYEDIGFAEEKERDFIFNKFHDLSFKEYYSMHIPQVMSKL